MIKIEKQIDLKCYESRAFLTYFEGMTIGMLDIESTGLSPRNSQLILGGLVVFDLKENAGGRFLQFFADSLSDEAEVLATYLEEIGKLDAMVTFNGKHFDLSYMDGRIKDLQLNFEALSGVSAYPFNLDLYLMANGYSDLRKMLPNLKQKTVEAYFGLNDDRSDEIDGGESIELYGQFLAEKNRNKEEAAIILRQILLHNADDICQLSRLIKLIEKCDFHKGMFKLGFPVISNDVALKVESIEVGKNELVVSGIQQKNPIGYISFGDVDREYALDFNRYDLSFRLSLPLLKKEGLYYVDLIKLFGETPEALEKYPNCQSGFLVLKNGKDINYLETNHFVKLLLEKIISEIH